MKTYVSQPQDSFAGLAEKFNIKDENYLRTFHNLNCPEENIIQGEIPAGTEILIPEDPQYFAEERHAGEDADEMNGYGNEAEDEQQDESCQDAEDEQKYEDRNGSGPAGHDGKYFVIPKGKAICDQGTRYPHFKVTSHHKHYWNNESGEPDYLAVTEDDLLFDPPVQSFGQCRLKPTSGGYLPCACIPSGKWQNTYDKVKVMDKSCLTEISELRCMTGGKITVLKHGQQAELGKSNIGNADSRAHHLYNPLIDFDEFRDETGENNEDAW
ncbi:DUF4280 domain-containing protein [uncultured Chryseobacterium sp.]|uniref:DUF4280 domain-containing protein n=1 Tax=uncultured Chryseobacterium sp. TaxID=259322 RepID=UPI0025FA984A|nr:DUF4280 domain-containing protein [uncultured Chryseobacterium sp.]